MKLRLFILCITFLACKENKPENHIPEPYLKVDNDIQYVIEKVLPHDTSAFTEGLFFHKNDLYESTGHINELPVTKSGYGVLDTTKGILKYKYVFSNRDYFGEGSVGLNDQIIQITYKSQIGFVFNSHKHTLIKTFKYPNEEGWGLTTNGAEFIMSDGSAEINFLNLKTFEITKKLVVSKKGEPVDNLNELEFANGFLYANVYPTNKIVKIDPSSGIVVGSIDVSQLSEKAKAFHSGALECNGIAYDSNQDAFFLTGKMWPFLFKVKLIYQSF